jgi:hypothetical protein
MHFFLDFLKSESVYIVPCDRFEDLITFLTQKNIKQQQNKKIFFSPMREESIKIILQT